MMKRILIPICGLALMVAVVSCTKSAKMTQTEAKKEISEEEAYKSFKNNPGDGKAFGEKIDAKNAVAYDDILPKLKALKGVDNI